MQVLSALGLIGKGLVPILFIMGVVLVVLNIQHDLGMFTIYASIILGILLLILGVVGVIKRLAR
ncbi:Uncharacterised protein [Candidatus Gugararchaeum adminiculabundum]|nr:Uncharacterised protein [Candidatus Gugararchaeum adminiculabundum]